jgi:hypothetical protein
LNGCFSGFSGTNTTLPGPGSGVHVKNKNLLLVCADPLA